MTSKARCIGRLCDPKTKHLYEGAPGGSAFRYTEMQCKRACEEGSNLCKICNKHEQEYMNKPSHKFPGRIGGPLTEEAHIVGSKWNIDMRVKEAKAAARKQTMELKKAEAAAKREEKAVRASDVPRRRKTQKKSSSSRRSTSSRRSSSSRRSRRVSSPVIYRPASNQSGQSPYVQKWAGTPLRSENKGSANRATLDSIVAQIAPLPELE